jgi:hypothetical protein
MVDVPCDMGGSGVVVHGVSELMGVGR